ncbi:MAG: DUF4389 domain-containing protein [Maritimibacter sp.]|nr:DUF4389 domain-containing protein [Maritimibacter sp.]
MAEDDKKPKGPSGADIEPQVLAEPGGDEDDSRDPGTWEIEDEPENPWMRGLYMVIFAVLFELGKLLLLAGVVIQFLFLLFAKEKNRPIADFGKDLGDWFARVARFQAGTTEEKPFPFARWGESE